MSIRPSFLCLVLSLLLAPSFARAELVTPKEIQESWVGKPLNGTVGNGRGFTMTLGANGVITISGEAANDTGVWRLSDNGYCTTWKTIRAGQERCFTVLKLMSGEMRVINPDGSISGYINRVQ